MATPISTRKLCYEILKVPKRELLALVASSENYYSPFEQRKKGRDKIRVIEPSNGYLKTIQKKIDKLILKPAMKPLQNSIMGGRKGISVTDNAEVHRYSRAFMKYDVQDFFPSVTYQHVYYIFRYRLNYCEESANILTKLCTYPESRPHLPQGSPASTSLATFALEPLCIKVQKIASENDLKFSIWIDDITISGKFEKLHEVRPSINYLLSMTPFTIHRDKDTGIVKKGSRVKNASSRSVTGIIIDNNNRLTLGSKKYKSLRRRVASTNARDDSLHGSLQFLKQVNPSQGKKLLHEYELKIIKE